MITLSVGKHAPGFTLPTVEGEQFSLENALSHGPVVLAFFKISCPVCQYAFPYYERLHKSLRGRGVTLIGISQNDKADTLSFMETFGVTFPIALDDPSNYAVSNAYGLTNVPTLFEIDPEGKILTSAVGWSRSDVESIHNRYNGEVGAAPMPLFGQGEQVADFKAG